MNEPLMITSHWDQGVETLTVDAWPRATMVESVILANPRRGVLDVDGEMMTITVANGQAVYRLARDEYSPYHLAIPAYLVSSRISVD